ncbi:MAG: cobyric acid synthase CobQ, partial [Pseudomonadota bacterium]
GRVLGICGGYQMLGQEISDPCGIEGRPGTTPGLGLLNVVTEMVPDKTLTRVTGTDLATRELIEGYEIHIGRTTGPDTERPIVDIDGRPQGAQSASGQIQGVYLHGLFTQDSFRTAWLRNLGARSPELAYEQAVDATLDALAKHLEEHLNIDGLLDIAHGR